mgnify:CR=1 FL=1
MIWGGELICFEVDSDIDVASLMMKQFEVEFVFDERERIRSSNYWRNARAAKFVLGITRATQYGGLVVVCLKKSVLSYSHSLSKRVMIRSLVFVTVNNTFLSCRISSQAQNENLRQPNLLVSSCW